MAISDAAGGRALRALTVARALEADGHYNPAKILRATAISELLRATKVFPEPGPARTAALAAVLAEQRAIRGNDALVQTLATVVSAIQDDRDHVTITEAPPTMICRTCGEVLLGEPPPTCPRCGARQATFYEELPIYFLTPLPVKSLLALMHRGSAEVMSLCSGLDETDSSRTGWSSSAIVRHLIAVESLFVQRAEQLLQEHEPTIESRDQALDGVAPLESLADLIDIYRDQRTETLARLDTLTPEQWERRGVHPEWGRFSMQQLFTYLTLHEQSHLRELDTRCRALRPPR